MIETTYKDNVLNDEKFLVLILNLIDYFSDVVDIKNILKYEIFMKFQTYFKSDLKKCDVDIIKIFIHQKMREIKIIKMTLLFNVIKVIKNRKNLGTE